MNDLANRTADQSSIPIPLPLGVELWWIGNGYRQEYLSCPECAGTKALEFIKGNGEHVTIACGNCSSGYDEPTGRISRTFYAHAPQRFMAKRVSMSGEDFYYHDNSDLHVSAGALFRDYDQCVARCLKLNEERNRQEIARDVAMLASKRRSAAFSVSYWSKQVQDLEHKLEVARARLTVCKAKKPGEAA